MSETKIEETEYGGFGKCIRISNGSIQVMVTVDFGPRIINFSFVKGVNEFCENHSEATPLPDGEWKIRGGHRLWHSPESMPRTYFPDDSPVNWTAIDGGIRVSQPLEKWTQVKKEMDITMSLNSNKVKVIHKLTNKGPWPIEYAAWAISVMAAGGVLIIPQPVRDTGLLPNRMVSLWAYSKMNDPRVYWGDRYIAIKQMHDIDSAFKLGLPDENGWAAYFNHGNVFIKRFPFIQNGKYPDYGSSYETYTNHFMMEMESLSPLKLVQPDETLEHTEEWELKAEVPEPTFDESEIECIVKKYIE